MHMRRKFFPSSSTMRRRLFWLLGGMSLGAIMIVNLAWLQGKITEIVETQDELQRVAIQGVRNQLGLFLEEKEQAMRSQAMVLRSPFLEGNQEALRLLAHRFLQREPAFVEIAIRDQEGQERLRISRLLTITEQDLSQQQVPVFLQRLRPREVSWGPVVTTDTSESWVTLATPLERSETAIVGMVLGTLNLKA